MNLFDSQIPVPDLRIAFRVIPTANDFMATASNPYAAGANTKKWRDRGRERAKAVFDDLGLPTEVIRRELRSKDKNGQPKVEYFPALLSPYFEEPVGVIVRLWRPSNGQYDIPNLHIKAVMDGFTDVRLWVNDSVKELPELGFRFEGVDPSLKLTAAEVEERRIYAQSFRDRGATPPRMSLPARIWFDITRLSVLPTGSIYATW